MKSTKMKIEKRRAIYASILGLLFDIFWVFGSKMYYSAFKFTDVSYSILDIVIFIIGFVILTIASYFFIGITLKHHSDKKVNVKFWKIFLPLMAVSVFLLIAIFPGHYPYDAGSMNRSYTNNHYSTHFAPIISFTIGSFISLGKELFNSANIGHALLMFLQLTFVNYAIAKTIVYCSNNIKRKWFAIIMTIFFMIHPLVQMLLIRSGQDTIFGGFFLLLCLELLKISENEKYFNKKSSFIKIFFFTFLLCITRNNGIYALIPMLIASAFLIKIKPIRKCFFIAFLIPILCFFGYKELIIKKIVQSSDSFYGETLNIPHLQIARSMYYNPDNESLEELKTYYIEGCTDWKGVTWGWYRGASGISDPYKGCFHTGEVEKDLLKFIGLWAKIGSKNISNYIEAPFIFSLGLYHPYTKYYAYNSPHTWQPYVDGGFGTRNADGLEDVNTIPFIRKAFEKLILAQGWSKIPVLHHLWRGTLTTYLCIFGIIFALYRRKKQYLLPLSLILGLIATVALSPVVFFRYLFPAVICAPIMLYIIIRSIDKS